jgi:hypothetical protein
MIIITIIIIRHYHEISRSRLRVVAGYDMQINSSSFRMITVTSYVTITVLLAAYSAALISFVTVQNVKLPFTTFQGLLQQAEYRLTTVQGTAYISYFNVRTEVPPLLLRHYLIVTHRS